MKVSVVVPAYNEELYLEKCLEALCNQTEKPDEIIVVDNNSTDNTVAIARQFPVKVITAKKQGITPARNKGFNQAQYDIIVRTDADTRVPKNWIKRIKKIMTENPHAVAISGPAKFYGLDAVRRRAYWQSELIYFRSFKQLIHNEALFGPNMAIRKEAWNKVKKELCPSDKIVHEDTDLAIHVGAFGDILFVKNLIVMSSSRRWKKIVPHFEYPYRYLRTIQHHKQSLHALKTGADKISHTLPQPKKLIKTVKLHAQNNRVLQKYL